MKKECTVYDNVEMRQTYSSAEYERFIEAESLSYKTYFKTHQLRCTDAVK